MDQISYQLFLFCLFYKRLEKILIGYFKIGNNSMVQNLNKKARTVFYFCFFPSKYQII